MHVANKVLSIRRTPDNYTSEIHGFTCVSFYLFKLQGHILQTFFKWHYSVIGVENCSLAAVSDNGDCASANNSSKLQEKPILTTGIISQSALFLPFM